MLSKVKILLLQNEIMIKGEDYGEKINLYLNSTYAILQLTACTR